MMRRINYIATYYCCILIFNLGSGRSSIQHGSGPAFDDSNGSAPKVELKHERVFTGSGLYGFMNGGADLYLEYGIRKLIAGDILYEGDEYNIEVYEMFSAEDAFGIYSLHTFRCQRADTLGCIDCLSPYQLQAVAGNLYVSVVFPSGSDAAKKKADAVIRMYATLNQENIPAIPDLLQMEPPFSGRLKYLRGPISVLSTSASLSQLVKDAAYTGIWFKQERRSKKYQALILFSDSDNALKIKEKILSSDLIEAGVNHLYISGKEKAESEEDFGVFGF